MWAEQRTISLDAARTAGIYQQPVTFRAFDAPRPTIKSVVVLNQSPNTQVGICWQQPKADPDVIVLPNYILVLPIAGIDCVAFVFNVPQGGQQTGKVFLQVTDEKLAAASASVPPAVAGGAFVLDYSLLDSGAQLQ